MFQIFVNGTITNVGQPLPAEITYCSIIYPPMLYVPIPADQLPFVKAWFHQLLSNCTCEYILFNTIYYRVDELSLKELL